MTDTAFYAGDEGIGRLAALYTPTGAESPFAGIGFGLGFGVVIDPVPSRVVCSEGELSWGGAASTAFWIDQREELAVAFYTQLLPSSTYRIRPQLRQLVYQALTG
jgi:CubicO group peptidase (beta-lactamase class C family)